MVIDDDNFFIFWVKVMVLGVEIMNGFFKVDFSISWILNFLLYGYLKCEKG